MLDMNIIMVWLEMDNNLPLQLIASKNNIAVLDRTQNQTLRCVCGGKRLTPTATCKIEANIKLMDLRIKRSFLESVEIYKRQEEDHPLREIVDTWKEVRRLQQSPGFSQRTS